MLSHLLHYFTDPIVRGPVIGSMLMCMAASMVGVLAYVRGRSLLGEALSHATYPGIIMGVVGYSFFFPDASEIGTVFVLVIASISAFLALWVINKLEYTLSVKSDSALCFVLAAFFGFGITLASSVQFTHSALYRQAQTYLYGQAATMTDFHIYLYSGLSVLVVLTLVLFYKELVITSFDRAYAQALGISTPGIDAVVTALLVVSIITGMRSVGVILISALLIGPAVAARQFTDKLSTMLVLAAIVGMLSAFFGVYASVEGTRALHAADPFFTASLPTGPMIVVCCFVLCLLSLLLAPRRGYLVRQFRSVRFKLRCERENLLKSLWRKNEPQSLVDLSRCQNMSRLRTTLHCLRLRTEGWCESAAGLITLSVDGKKRAARIVRLHRLWELYLVDALGLGTERVHKSAEEMEHILTPELETALSALLKDPQVDPHQQPIPDSYGGPGAGT